MSIRTWNDPILKQVCDEVAPGEDTSALRALMLSTCKELNGAGLAAPQVGVGKRAVLMMIHGGKGRFFINPSMVSHSETKSIAWEGCLSYPGKFKRIARWTTIIVAFEDAGRNARTENFYGFAARVIQHEMDHLDGVCRVGDDSPDDTI